MTPDDPFYELSLTQEEVEVEGEMDQNANAEKNVARKIITKIRKRKGLAVDERVVKDANKQRTMTRMK